MNLRQALLAASSTLLLFSCVSSKKFKQEQARYKQLDSAYQKLRGDLKSCEDLKSDEASKRKGLEDQIDALNKQIAFLKENNNTVLTQLKDLSVLSNSQAESIKKSLDNIGAKDAYIKDLQSAMARKDSLNMALVMNLKSALSDVNDKDVNIKTEKGVVFIDISDKMLFNSGSYAVTTKANEVLGKVAKILNAHPDIEFMVEGHTDTVQIKNSCILDNWDLSVKRATAVTRILQNKYGIAPARMTAAGRGEYIPLTGNDSSEGRAANRRTRIVILPQLDQFFQLLEKH